MKIYDFEGFPNPARVRIALAEKGVINDMEFITVDVPNGDHRKPEFIEKNPGAAVPVLELDDGTCISECTAITEFIDHHFDGVKLTGENAKQRAVIHMMNRRAEQNVLDAVGGYFHHATPGLGPDIETYQNQDWGIKQKDKALSGMEYFDNVLANQNYIAGDKFSMADITVFTGLAFADFAKIDIPEKHINLQEWRDRVAARPSLAA